MTGDGNRAGEEMDAKRTLTRPSVMAPIYILAKTEAGTLRLAERTVFAHYRKIPFAKSFCNTDQRALSMATSQLMERCSITT